MHDDPEVTNLAAYLVGSDEQDRANKQLHAEVREHLKADYREANRGRAMALMGSGGPYRPSRWHYVTVAGFGGTGLLHSRGAITGHDALWLCVILALAAIAIAVIEVRRHRRRRGR